MAGRDLSGGLSPESVWNTPLHVTCLGFRDNADKALLIENVEFIKCDITEKKQLLSALNNKHRVKGKSSMKLQMEFSHIKKASGGCHVWARGFFVASSGNVPDEVIMEYIQTQDVKKEDEDFKIDS